MLEMTEIISLLLDGSYSCVIFNNVIRTFNKQGVMDLLNLYFNEPDFLDGAFVADKIVGKAAASLLVLGNIKKLYAHTISKPALELLKNARVEIEYKNLTDFVMNRDKSDLCPLEKTCLDGKTPSENLNLILQFFEKNKK